MKINVLNPQTGIFDDPLSIGDSTRGQGHKYKSYLIGDQYPDKLSSPGVGRASVSRRQGGDRFALGHLICE